MSIENLAKIAVLAAAVIAVIALNKADVKVVVTSDTDTQKPDQPLAVLPTDFDGWWDYATLHQVPKVTSFDLEAKDPIRNRHVIQPVIVSGRRALLVRFNLADKSMAVLVKPTKQGDYDFDTTIGCMSAFDKLEFVGCADPVGAIVRHYGLRSQLYA